MRVLEAAVAGWHDPAAVFASVAGDASLAVWLDSGAEASRGTSTIAVGARSVTASAIRRTLTVDGVERPGELLPFLREQLAASRIPEGAGFRLGWTGWLGYGLRAQTMGLPLRGEPRHPDAALLFVERAVVFDHAARTVRLVALGEDWTPGLAAWRDRTVEAILGARMPRPEPAEPAAVAWATTDDDYLEQVRRCQRAIVEGDAYQLCLTTEARVDARADPLAAYLRLRAASPTRHGALLRVGEVSLLAASPERFLAVAPDGWAETRPIKGTRPRGTDPVGDSALAEELRSSEKERAENLMIVDLMRNDLGRVSALGTVTVTELLAVESYAQVHQLVSTVRGRLAEGRDAIDAVASCFPAGSMTGAPKRRAVQLLDEIEGRERGVYAGAFGYFGLDGRVDLAMVIRSIVLDAHGATVGAGGGITALSVPEEELAEMHLKAAVLLEVLGAATA